MASIFSKDKRIILVRRIKNFWEEFSHSKLGLLGLFMISVYVFVALAAPFLTPYDPISQPRLAQSFAQPEWVTIFPGNGNLTKTKYWDIYWTPKTGSQYVAGAGRFLDVNYTTNTLGLTEVDLSGPFSFRQLAPNEFFLTLGFQVTGVQNVEYSVTLTLNTPNGTQYRFWGSDVFSVDHGETVTVDSQNPMARATLGFKSVENVGKAVFGQQGDYEYVLALIFRSLSTNAKANVSITGCQLATLGHVHGILGTDYLAKDIFTVLIYGTRLSLSIGLLAALAGTVIGILVGVASGYLGGAVDEISMRAVDILICIPMLPLLLALVNVTQQRNVYYIVVFIAIFGWQGLARVIRSQTLSIRETAYIDTARASGASGGYVMLRHIIPNIIPVAFASMVLAVPSAILFEAALSFLGFGDPRVPTWGNMLENAFGFGAFTHPPPAWWWIIPPGLAIIGLCLAFVFLGYAFDEMVNPRLRRRR
jgi:peptide/nickel transport system permease protein